jgi:membrane fusion protein (multidrug efflux system)
MIAGCWLAWAFNARISRYETSDSARLEIVGAAYPLEAPLAGTIISSSLVLGSSIQAGEVLAQLDARDQELALGEQRTRLATLGPQIDALRSQLKAEEDGAVEDHRVAGLSVASADAQLEDAQAQAALAEKDAERARQLKAEGIISEAEYQRSQTESSSKRSIAENLAASRSRVTPEANLRDRDREARQKQILEEIAKLQADFETGQATIRRLAYEVERRRILAPIAGRLAECAALRPGSHVNEGERLGVILPPGRVQVVAQFDPSAALGKVRPGQSATVRLQGFPWAQFGTIHAEVARVASDIRDNKLRVELAVKQASSSRIPFQHGLPGSVEVEVERVSPIALVLRAAGRFVGAH